MASAEDKADYSVDKDAIEGIRLQAVENINKYQAETIKWHDRKVRLKNIKPGHLVLRRVANLDTVGKLQLKWAVIWKTRDGRIHPVCGWYSARCLPVLKKQLLEKNGKVRDLLGKLQDRKSTRLNSSHITRSRMPSSA